MNWFPERRTNTNFTYNQMQFITCVDFCVASINVTFHDKTRFFIEGSDDPSDEWIYINEVRSRRCRRTQQHASLLPICSTHLVCCWKQSSTTDHRGFGAAGGGF